MVQRCQEVQLRTWVLVQGGRFLPRGEPVPGLPPRSGDPDQLGQWHRMRGVGEVEGAFAVAASCPRRPLRMITKCHWSMNRQVIGSSPIAGAISAATVSPLTCENAGERFPHSINCTLAAQDQHRGEHSRSPSEPVAGLCSRNGHGPDSCPAKECS
jgi:hypothetical protein